jgi:hypothetical protein
MEKEALTGAHQLPAQTLFSDGSLRKSGRRVAAVNRDRLDGSKFQSPCHSQWDDEQIAIWLNRQLDPAMLTPMGVAGYRVDVRNPGTLELHSLSRGQGDVLLGDMNLGEFNDEFAVEAAPLQLAGKKTGDYWLPSYFTTWKGSSLVLRTETALRLAKREHVLAARPFSAASCPSNLLVVWSSQLPRSIPECPCLKRHEINGTSYAIKKSAARSKPPALRSASGMPLRTRKLAERKLREWLVWNASDCIGA